MIKLNVTEDVVKSLPEGVTWNDPNKKPVKGAKVGSIMSIEDGKDGDIVNVGEFTVNLAVVDKDQLINLRKYMPREEYRLVKNRKIARLCRLKRKNERGEMQNNLKTTATDLEEAMAKIA